MRVDFNSFHVKVGLIVELEVIEQVKLVFYKTRRIINQEGSSNGLSEEISFKILKQEVISRNVLVDECSRQVVEVEQAAMWKFLWWSGIIAVHVMVGQNIDDHSKLFSITSSSLCLLFPSWFAG
ncbi:uncharacterized protein LOC113281411 isoform X1 [Papaver somniferum]|uniref:uncharacterized protein LOC113281411 isoform X1 n=1 Tax=Papaver somniferum TaxID=3469 RepID=UPI000E7042B0|nr:uncharacterized protein LOC113281411 isoform X1 [Papaver somniferum]